MSLPGSSNTESDDFDEEDAGDAAPDAEDVDVDHLIKNLDRLKRRSARAPEPAWRRLERYREDRRTEELLSDFDDYEVDEPAAQDASEPAASPAGRRRKKGKH